ncbi:MAG: PQQ-binding-like beta-propeller repeat protein [Acidobacteriota bacterium]
MTRQPNPSLDRPLAALVVTLLAAGLGLATTESARADWDRFRGGPQQVGVTDSTLAAQPKPVWTYRLPESGEASAAIVDGAVYVVGLSGRIAALDLATGAERWTADVREDVKSSPLVADGLVYFGDELGRLHAFDAKTGTERFVFEAGAAITGAPNLGGGCLLVPSYDNSIYCVDPQKGEERWNVETAGYVHGSAALASVASEDGAVDTAIVSGCDGLLRLIDLADGTERAALPIGSYVAASPAVHDGRVFVGTFDNEVLAVELDAALAVGPAPAPDAEEDPKLATAIAEAIRWRYENPARDFPFYSSPAIHDGVVFVGGRDKLLHAIDAETGAKRWSHSFRARVDASPVVIPAATGQPARVAIADESGVLKLFAVADGTVTWEFEGADGFVASPAVAAGHLVIPATDGTVYAFK